MELLSLLFWVLFTTLVSRWAHSWGRVWWQFTLLSFLCSPIVPALVLSIMGKDKEVLEDRARELQLAGWRRCQMCGKQISPRYATCSFCGSAVERHTHG